jgi:hypothetical protein
MGASLEIGVAAGLTPSGKVAKALQAGSLGIAGRGTALCLPTRATTRVRPYGWGVITAVPNDPTGVSLSLGGLA